MATTALRLSPPPSPRLEPSALRQRLVDRFPDAVLLPDRALPAIATGVSVLDQILPNGGFPRGRVVVWRGRSEGSAGTTAILRSAFFGLLQQGQRVAWVDGRKTERTLTASLRLTSRFLPERFQWAPGPFGQVARLEAATMEITATAPGWSRTATFSIGVTSHDLRLSLDPGLADRRGDLG